MFNILKSHMRKFPIFARANENYESWKAAHIKNLKQTLSRGLDLKKVHRVVKFNQKLWAKQYIDMNTKHRKQR